MDIQAATALAHQLMAKHGLSHWKFVMDNAKRRFGQCSSYYRTINLSGPLTRANEFEAVKDTILHEIAHALVGAGQGHNNVWKRKCIEIGCKPERCYSSKDTTIILGRYVAECGACKKIYTRHKKKDSTVSSSCRCQTGKPWSERVLLTYKDTKAAIHSPIFNQQKTA